MLLRASRVQKILLTSHVELVQAVVGQRGERVCRVNRFVRHLVHWFVDQVAVNGLLHHLGVLFKLHDVMTGLQSLFIEAPHLHNVLEERLILKSLRFGVAHRAALILQLRLRHRVQLVEVLLCAAKVALGLYMSAADFLNALRKAHVGEELGAERFVVRQVLRYLVSRKLLLLLCAVHEHDLAEVVQERPNN